MKMLLSLFMLLFFGALSAYIAKQKDRDPVGWFLIGVLLGIFSPLILLFLPNASASKNGPKDTQENEDRLLEIKPGQLSNLDDYSSKEWFYLHGTQHSGPFSFLKIQSLWNEGKIQPVTFVWTEGMAEWKKIADLQNLQNNLKGKS